MKMSIITKTFTVNAVSQITTYIELTSIELTDKIYINFTLKQLEPCFSVREL